MSLLPVLLGKMGGGGCTSYGQYVTASCVTRKEGGGVHRMVSMSLLPVLLERKGVGEVHGMIIMSHKMARKMKDYYSLSIWSKKSINFSLKLTPTPPHPTPPPPRTSQKRPPAFGKQNRLKMVLTNVRRLYIYHKDRVNLSKPFKAKPINYFQRLVLLSFVWWRHAVLFGQSKFWESCNSFR